MEHISTINREYQSLAAVENLRLRQQILTPTAHNYKFTLDKTFKTQLARMYNKSQLAAIDVRDFYSKLYRVWMLTGAHE